MSIRPFVIGGAIVGGAALAYDAIRHASGKTGVDGEGETHGSVIGWFTSHADRGWWTLTHLNHPRSVATVYDGARDAKLAQKALFRPTDLTGVDDAADAFRHTYASALVTERLIADRGYSPDAAASYMHEVGVANEDDSQLSGDHYEQAREMDLHNNDVGIELGIAAAAAGGVTDIELQQQALDAIRAGETTVLDPASGVTRASTADDLPF